jgi:hypothetical protein
VPTPARWKPEAAQPREQLAASLPQPESDVATPWDPQFEQNTEVGSPDMGAPAPAAPLGELFSDLDLPDQQEPSPEGSQQEGLISQEDPLAALAAEEPTAQRRPVENTSYFVQKAGVNRRNPPWKIALFIVLLIALPVGALYLVTELQVVPLKVTRVDAQGRAVEEQVSVFSAEGIGELRDLLMGREKPPPPPPPPPAPAPKAPEAKAPGTPEAQPAQEGAAPVDPEARKELESLYAGDGSKEDVGPEVREEAEVAAADSAASEGPPQEEVAKVVAQSQGAFQGCIEQALRKNPRLRGGKVILTATVGSSGTVKKASFDRKDMEGSTLGDCLKARARRMVFPSFSGEDVEVEIPLVLTKSM